MWNIGFEKYLKEILEAFLGEISYGWTRGSTNFELTLLKEEEKNVLIQLTEDEVTYQEEISYEAMYEVLVPNHKMDYLYLFQDVLDELKEDDAKEIVLKSYIDDILKKMSRDIIGRKEKMEVVKEEPILELVSGKRFTQNGIEYEQMALAI